MTNTSNPVGIPRIKGIYGQCVVIFSNLPAQIGCSNFFHQTILMFMKFAILTFIISLFCSPYFLAQEPVCIPDKAGTWTYGYLNDENTKLFCRKFGMTPEEAVVFRKKLDQIVEVLHLNPVMASPKGVDPTVESRPLYPHGFETHPENYGYIGEINFRLVTWFNSKGRIYRQTIEPPRVSAYINNITPLRHSAFNVSGMDDAVINKLADRVLDICRPMKIRELAPGVVLYDYAIVADAPGKSLFLPLSVGEAYNRLIAYYEAVTKMQPAFKVMLDVIKQAYGTLTPEQLAGPAYFGGMASGITYQKNSDPLQLFNNDYFDRKMPKTAVQVITFPVNSDYFRKESDYTAYGVGSLRIHQFLHSLDVNALAGLVDK